MDFQIHYSYFEYQIMFFNLFKTLASFKGYINKILPKKLDFFVIIYLDNIFIYAKDLVKVKWYM